MAGFWSRSRRVLSREFLFDPRLQLLERREGLLELAELGVRGPLVGSTEEAERLQPVEVAAERSLRARRSIFAWRSRERIRSARADSAADSPARVSA